MKKITEKIYFSEDVITHMIYLIRGRKVMFDKDLAKLYGVGTKILNQAVKRNVERFPEDFMFQISFEEAMIPRSQFVTLESGKNIKYCPYVFTEQGVAMLSSVLRSERAIQVNIQIMRMFTKMREMMETHKELRVKIEELEKKYDAQFGDVFAAIKQLFNYVKEEKSKRKIGFKLVPSWKTLHHKSSRTGASEV